MDKNTITLITILSSVIAFQSCKSTNTRSHNSTNSQVTTLAPTSPFEDDTIDGVLATVGNQIILLSDLQNAILISSNFQTRLYPNGRLIGGNITETQAKQILDSLINQKVLQIKATELGIDISEEELTQRINEFIKQKGLTESELENQLAKSNKSMKDYRAEFKNESLKQQLIGRVILPLVNVSDDEVKSFYLQQTGSIKQVSTVKLRSLLIKIPENEKENPLNSQLVKVIEKKISAGENFVTLVKEYSMASDAVKSEGILPPRPIANLPAPLREKLANLKINQIVGPIVFGSSVFFFQYLGADFTNDSDLEKNFYSWKTKLQDIKFNERLVEYLKTERKKLKANIRPFEFHR